jgi:putative DNA methylase
MRDEAERRIGHLYPKATLADGRQATVIAWLWARTVTCPNPACRSTMPLVRSFWLGKKKGKESWVRPMPESEQRRVRFEIGHGKGGPPVKGTVGRNGATCIVCSTPVALSYVREEGRAGRLGSQLMAIVAEGDRQRVYLPPTEAHDKAAEVTRPDDVPDTDLFDWPGRINVYRYGMTKHADLFTNRQLVALTTFSDLVREARSEILADSGGETAYADAISLYLALSVDRIVMTSSTLVRWNPVGEKAQHMSGRLPGSCRCLYRSPLLRQHRICRLIRCLLRMASPISSTRISRAPRNYFDPKVGRAGSNTISVWRQPQCC